MLLDGPDANTVKLCDFGLSRLVSINTYATEHPEVGTAACECGPRGFQAQRGRCVLQW